MVEQHHAAEIRDPHHVDIHVQQVDVERFDGGGMLHGQHDVDAPHLQARKDFANRVNVAEHRQDAGSGAAVMGSGDESQRQRAVGAGEFFRQFMGRRAGADDH
ncbi:hypothetical protein D3C84_689600 [compost metagenome]